MICMGELTSFMRDMHEREDSRNKWDYYLARVYDKSFAEWLGEIESNRTEARHRAHDEGMTQEQIIEQTLRIAAISRKEV